MKPSFALILGTVAFTATLAGCGQPGPLYMPKPPKAGAPAPAAPVAAPSAGAEPSPDTTSPTPTKR